MDTKIRGKAYVVGESIDTDQIIPAQYLVYSTSDPEERRHYGRLALAGLPAASQGLPGGGTPFVREDEFTSDYQIIIAGPNFGCGSSREHAPLALAEAGATLVIAESYARIFFRNCVNGGYVIPAETRERLYDRVKTGDDLEVDTEANTIVNHTQGETYPLAPIGDILPILEAGDVFEYAKKSGMLG